MSNDNIAKVLVDRKHFLRCLNHGYNKICVESETVYLTNPMNRVVIAPYEIIEFSKDVCLTLTENALNMLIMFVGLINAKKMQVAIGDGFMSVFIPERSIRFYLNMDNIATVQVLLNGTNDTPTVSAIVRLG